MPGAASCCEHLRIGDHPGTGSVTAGHKRVCRYESRKRSQLLCLSLGKSQRLSGANFPEHRNFGIGVFPEREEVLISCAGFDSAFLHRVSASEAEMGQRTHRTVLHEAAVVEDLLELRGCRGSFPAAAARSITQKL
jgi:hypothetical protein